MNINEARDRALNALAGRLRAWGVTDPEVKARDYIGGLQRDGWVWMSPENRPVNPRPEEACRTCGAHLERCRCDEPAQRPSDPSPVAGQHLASLRGIYRTATASICKHGPGCRDCNNNQEDQ